MATYSEKLRDPRWQRKRLEILQAANFKCEDCGDVGTELQIHHSCYVKGREPWDYDIDLLMCLCQPCHDFRQQREDAIRVSLAKILRFLPPDQIESEAWKMIGDMSERETQRLAQTFS